MDDQHFPMTKLMCIEQTHNKCGGRVLPLEYIDKCGQLCKVGGHGQARRVNPAT